MAIKETNKMYKDAAKVIKQSLTIIVTELAVNPSMSKSDICDLYKNSLSDSGIDAEVNVIADKTNSCFNIQTTVGGYTDSTFISKNKSITSKGYYCLFCNLDLIFYFIVRALNNNEIGLKEKELNTYIGNSTFSKNVRTNAKIKIVNIDGSSIQQVKIKYDDSDFEGAFTCTNLKQNSKGSWEVFPGKSLLKIDRVNLVVPKISETTKSNTADVKSLCGEYYGQYNSEQLNRLQDLINLGYDITKLGLDHSKQLNKNILRELVNAKKNGVNIDEIFYKGYRPRQWQLRELWLAKMQGVDLDEYSDLKTGPETMLNVRICKKNNWDLNDVRDCFKGAPFYSDLLSHRFVWAVSQGNNSLVDKSLEFINKKKDEYNIPLVYTGNMSNYKKSLYNAGLSLEKVTPMLVYTYMALKKNKIIDANVKLSNILNQIFVDLFVINKLPEYDYEYNFMHKEIGKYFIEYLDLDYKQVVDCIMSYIDETETWNYSGSFTVIMSSMFKVKGKGCFLDQWA